ncbi:MAG: gamma-glutamyltransferase [Candidatus Promineifilaceae bacterium]
MEFEKFNFPSRRSNTIAMKGMVATSQPLAAQAGVEILQAGGNAVDAAIATAAALCVLEPCSTGLGGDAFALIWSASKGRLFGLNASGPAPRKMTLARIKAMGWSEMPERGPLSITVPGSVKGWEAACDHFGSLSLDLVLRRATEYAREGYPVSQRIAKTWAQSTELLKQHPDSSRICLPGGRSPHAGEIFKNPGLANTLDSIASEGSDAFYRGHIGDVIVSSVQEIRGLLAKDDLEAYDVEWVKPIATTYRPEFSFYEMPPNGQGLTALLALNIVRGYDLQALGYGSPDFWHLLIEATKLAFADAAAYIGDPRMSQQPLADLLSEDYTSKRQTQISMDRAQEPLSGQPTGTGDTVYLTVADNQGNMVSWIQSLYMGFGSGITAGDTGVQLQNRGANFTLEEGHPNQLAPSKRPYHTIIPGFITHQGEPWCSFGVMGGFMQPQGHLQVGVNLVDFGMDPQSALDAPRFRWLKGRQVALEPGIPESVVQELTRRGHEPLTGDKAADVGFGGGQIIIRDSDSDVLIAGSEPRNDGAAIGW